MKCGHLFKVFCGVVVTLLLVGCGTQKVVTSLPCESDAIDDSLYIMELGVGVSSNLQYAREQALMDARFKHFSRFCNSLRMVIPQVASNRTGDSIYVGTNDVILFSYPVAFFGEFSYAGKECERVTYDSNNLYHCFVVLAFSKEDFKRSYDKVFFDYINITSQSTNKSE